MKRKRGSDGRLLLAAGIIVLVAGCGDNLSVEQLGRGRVDAAPDAAVEDAEVPTRDAQDEHRAPIDGPCASGLGACGEGAGVRCVDFNTDKDHCGACGRACAPGITCQAGTCQQYRCKSGVSFKALPYTVGPAPGSVAYEGALGDFDGDGILDFAGAPDAAGAMSLLYGAGDGSFPVHQPIDATATRWQAVAGDVDGDGVLDLASVSSTEPEPLLNDPSLTTLNVRLGAGTRSAPFGVPTLYPTGAGLISTTLADFDGDGRLDLVTSVRAGFEYRRGQAGGPFAAPAAVPSRDNLFAYFGFFPAPTATAADWNGDHILDLVYAAGQLIAGNSVHFKLGRGDGTFDTEVACALAMGAVGDMDNDGRVDLISGGFLLLGLDTCNPKKSVALADWPENGRSAVADLDGDGNLDLVVDGKVSVRLGDGQGGFRQTLSLPRVGGVATSSAAFLFGDLNRDRKLDLIYTQRDGWGVFLNTCQ